MRSLVLGTLVLLPGLVAVPAQNFSIHSCPSSDTVGGGGWFGSDRACEIRSATLPATPRLSVFGENGGIEVVGEDRSDIALEAKITAQAPSRSDAEALLHEVRVVANADGSIRAEGPHGGMRRSWSAGFRLRVPRGLEQTVLETTNGGVTVSALRGNLSVQTNNGGIQATRVAGDAEVKTTNGGIALDGIGGSVRATTTNGNVRVGLDEAHLPSGGVVATSTNGGIQLKTPANLAAHLIASTTNGGIHVGFPISVQGKLGQHVDTNLNGGGPTVRLQTTNGGISID